MKNNVLRNTLLLLLVLVFSGALMFAFIELPRLLDLALQENVAFPQFDQGSSEMSAYKSELFISAWYLRGIGYACLALVAFCIIMGFLTKKSSWAWAGAFTLFLPVFGQFALSMFFLAGLGVLRVGWLPFMEMSFNVLDLGQVIYVPYWILIWFFTLFDYYAHDLIAYFCMGLGAFLFTWGVLVWVQSRYGQNGVASSWIYRISRHPQYLGWIIWSYGIMFFSVTVNNMKKSWGVSSSLPWLLATMIIIGICLLEELRMKEKYGDAYEVYQSSAPFLFPMPKWMKNILKAPMRYILRIDWPNSRKQVAAVCRDGLSRQSWTVIVLRTE